MPHDKNGKVLQLGDEVILRGRVVQISPNETYCNCTVELTERMPTGEGEGRVEKLSAVNTRMFEKVEK